MKFEKLSPIRGAEEEESPLPSSISLRNTLLSSSLHRYSTCCDGASSQSQRPFSRTCPCFHSTTFRNALHATLRNLRNRTCCASVTRKPVIATSFKARCSKLADDGTGIVRPGTTAGSLSTTWTCSASRNGASARKRAIHETSHSLMSG